MKQAVCVLEYTGYICPKVLGILAPRGWGLPGGKVEAGETLEEAAIRELFEETGLVGVNPTVIFKAIDGDYEVTTFKMEYIKGAPRDSSEGRADYFESHLFTQNSSPFAEYNRKLFDRWLP